jgi:molybdenum cofactor guanylyltransferase
VCGEQDTDPRGAAVPASAYHRGMTDSSPTVAAFILAGGKSTRMGADKAFLMLDGCTLLERALEIARSITLGVRIVGDSAKFAPFAPVIPVIEDVFRDCGPLGGIHAALRASQSELNLILAVDLPFLSPALLQYLLTRASKSGATVTVAKSETGWQPLCAVYRREFADVAEKALREGRYKIDALFAPSQTQAIPEEDLEAQGFSPKMFRNLNTQQELQAAQQPLK